MNNVDNDTDESILRRKAIEVLGKNPIKNDLLLSETDLMKLVHELEVHQVELELQNEELLLSKSATRDAIEKYTELYDFAPSGYFTLTQEGEIVELNLRGANMLGKERRNLKNSQFGFFVSNQTRLIFNKFLENVFRSNTERNCVVSLATENNTLIDVYINGILTQKGNQCLATVVDITEHMLLIALQKKNYKLELYNKIMEDRESKVIELKKETNELLKKLGEEEKYVID